MYKFDNWICSNFTERRESKKLPKIYISWSFQLDYVQFSIGFASFICFWKKDWKKMESITQKTIYQ